MKRVRMVCVFCYYSSKHHSFRARAWLYDWFYGEVYYRGIPNGRSVGLFICYNAPNPTFIILSVSRPMCIIYFFFSPHVHELHIKSKRTLIMLHTNTLTGGRGAEMNWLRVEQWNKSIACWICLDSLVTTMELSYDSCRFEFNGGCLDVVLWAMVTRLRSLTHSISTVFHIWNFK